MGRTGHNPLKNMVPVGRIELPLGCPNRILSPARLPVPPHRHWYVYVDFKEFLTVRSNTLIFAEPLL